MMMRTMMLMMLLRERTRLRVEMMRTRTGVQRRGKH